MSSFKKMIAVSIITLAAVVIATSSASAAPLKVMDGQYKLPASLYPSVTSETKTELWAHVWRPKSGGRYPLVVFLHGNHATCGRFDSELGVRIDDRVDYTTTGKCPSGYVVSPSHLGYAYLAKALAAHGYVVVSINANRGVNSARPEEGDYGLNLRRGRLVLRHLQELAKWNRRGGEPSSLGFPLKGLIDFNQVGLMGHSRGGEGMRAAVAQFNDPDSTWPKRIGPLKFRSLFEIGPVDGQTDRTLNPVNLVWNVLLPGCDGDVSNLQGIKPFDRMLRDSTETESLNKSTFQVFGANHNFYNTEWQVSDATGCLGQTQIFPLLSGSQSQRRTALKTLIPFFRSNLGPAPVASLAKRFDPGYPIPPDLASETSYARGFTWSPRSTENFIIDDFDQPTGTSSRNIANQSSGLSYYEHGQAGRNQDPTQRAAAVHWKSPGGFLQVNGAAPGQGVDISGYNGLEFRVMLRCFGKLCTSPFYPTGDVDFSISVADANGGVSEPVQLKSLAMVRRPGGAWFFYNELFQTVRIPLSAFPDADLSNFCGVRFTFDRTRRSSICLANVRLTKAHTGPEVYASGMETGAGTQTPVQIGPQGEPQPELNRIVAIRYVSNAPSAAAKRKQPTPAVEIELASTRLFPVSGALPTLFVGDKAHRLSHFPSGATNRLVFTVKASDFKELSHGAEVYLRIGGAHPWKFGRFDKSIAR
jgi:hypothetical protein